MRTAMRWNAPAELQAIFAGLRMYLRYELQRPLELARHGYRTPFDSLQDKTRSILTQILAHLDYS